MHARILLGVSRSRGQEKVLGETKGSLLKGLPDFPPHTPTLEVQGKVVGSKGSSALPTSS